LLEVKQRLAPHLGVGHGSEGPQTIELNLLLLRTGVSREDASEIESLGLLTTTKRKGKSCIAKDDAWIIEVWGEMKRLGFTRGLGFTPRDMLIYADAMSAMFQREKEMLTERLSH